MLFPRSYAWTPVQRCLIATGVIIGVIGFSAVVYSYERYSRGPGESALFGVWEESSEGDATQYVFESDHTVEAIDPNDFHGPLVFARGRWHAGGRFVYLRFQVEDDSDPRLLFWRIEDISPNQLRVRYNPRGFLHIYKRVDGVAGRASNQTMQPTASPRTASLSDD